MLSLRIEMRIMEKTTPHSAARSRRTVVDLQSRCSSRLSSKSELGAFPVPGPNRATNSAIYITMYTILASAALLATTARALSVGTAHVVNKCEYDVYMFNTPAADGGYTEIDKTLGPGDSYSQQWTELSNGNGWSIKLSKNQVLGENILQYEYTFHDDGLIWYDLSEVDGNPWDANWEITASSPSSTCAPKQQAYRYATDDAYGMQACPQDSEITVTLCSGESQNDGGAASASSSVAAQTSSVAASTSPSVYSTTEAASSSTEAAPSSVEAPTTTAEASTTSAESVASTTPVSSTPTSTSAYSWRTHSWHQANAAQTTLATSTIATSTTSTGPDGVTVVEVETAVVTEIVTAYAKRNVHARHPHHVGA
ncbi:hypothetical protein LTR15_012649 [Elasticomyces elasticus]|nr:hypothetical protein LTR15_012649 [Elasticomyces elasticus]